jgi:hypothetical protein
MLKNECFTLVTHGFNSEVFLPVLPVLLPIFHFKKVLPALGIHELSIPVSGS